VRFQYEKWIVISALLALSGCFESEESCHKRLSNDFKSLADFSSSAQCFEAVGFEECMSVAEQALASSLKITLIWTDDDQDACDFVSDGSLLVRK
jgi:hypothetical protein